MPNRGGASMASGCVAIILLPVLLFIWVQIDGLHIWNITKLVAQCSTGLAWVFVIGITGWVLQ